MKKIVIIFVIIVFLVIGGVASRYFLIGRTLRAVYVAVEEIYIDESKIKLKGNMMASAEAFRSYSYRVKDDCVYIKIRSVIVSGLYRYGKIDLVIEGEFENIKAIYLEDTETTAIIWEKETLVEH